MNDRNKRDSIASFATQNGIKLPASFRDGDGTYRGSEEAKKLADRILDTMNGAIEAYVASGDKGAAQKNLSSLADLICELDKNAQAKRFAVQGDFEKLSAKLVLPDQSKNDKKTVCSFIKQTIEHIPYYVELGERGMNPTIGARITKTLENALDVLENQVVDGYSNKANNAAIGVANLLVNIRNDVSTGVVSSLYLGEFESEMQSLLDEWCAIKNAPTAKEICPDKDKVKLNHSDTFASLVQIPEIKNLATETFAAFDKMDPRKRYEEVVSQMDQLKLQYDAINAEIDGIVDLADNGRISDAEADQKIAALEAKQEELNKQFGKLNIHKENIQPEVDANAKFGSCMDMIRGKYEYYSESGQYPIFAQLFGPKEFDYSGVIRMMTTNPSADTKRKVKETVYTFAANLASREEAIKENSKMFEEIYDRQKNRGKQTGSILDNIPEGMKQPEKVNIADYNRAGSTGSGISAGGSRLAARRAQRAAQQGQNNGNQEQVKASATNEELKENPIFNFGNDN